MAVVTLDAGHGGYDNGASDQGRKEKDDNLNLALAVGNILQNSGVDVRYTRTEDIYQTPQRKAAIANENGSDLFISFHRNSSPSPNQYSGVQTLVYADSGPRRLLAQNINNELEKVGFTNLGVREIDYPSELKEKDLVRGYMGESAYKEGYLDYATYICQLYKRSDDDSLEVYKIIEIRLYHTK